jgi:two-component system response regulator TctD
MRVLIVEDNRPLSDWLARTLAHDRYVVDCAYDGLQADDLLASETFDLVILDLALPRMQGNEILARLRRRKNDVPVLILSANNTLAGRVGGLDVGADDYLAKPFEIEELEARMRALLRRSGHQKNPVLECGKLRYDTNTRIFSVDSTELSLTPREHTVLEALMTRLGKTVSKRGLATTMCTIDDDVTEDAIEIYVHRLRRKLEASDSVIITLRGLGYLMKQRDAH